VAAEIAANIVEHGLLTLFAPVRRVTGYDSVMPLARLEHDYMPSTGKIIEAVKSVLNYA
jgi:2-oxoisovalerate dehydrogenase E1 component beta subunit